ncbi:hypothetical protein [Rhodopirellula sp. SWK7]|uniref:hypothetical protein n=1 Tax=Rhodopirellula sp. SWK7 TaxID=595460 RepID=UPI0002BDFB96|nr:hypothetical protein [Rhodopirellula sp. SWK7]EMI43099.1 putative membrane protein [Rhodopirellula sp. SWK7]
MSSRPIRQQLLVEQDVQVSLVFRAVLYGAACMTYFTVIQFFTQAMHHPGILMSEIFLSLTDEAIYWVPGFLVLGPLMVYDMLRITNRVAGPIYSMRREMRAIAAGADGRGLKFRNDDYWDTLATEFNDLRRTVLELREENEILRANQAEPAPEEEAPEADEFAAADLEMSEETAGAVVPS